MKKTIIFIIATLMLVACERNPVVPDESPTHRVPGRPLVDGTVIKNAATDYMGLSITAAILRALADRLISGAPPSTRMLVLNRCRDANYPMPALLLMVLATVKDLVILSVVYAINLFCGSCQTLKKLFFGGGGCEHQKIGLSQFCLSFNAKISKLRL